MSTTGPDGGVWRWVSALLLAIMLAGAPGIYQALTAPSRAEVELLRERQQSVLQRLATNETLLAAMAADISRLEARVDMQAQKLEDHEDEKHGAVGGAPSNQASIVRGVP